MMADAAPDTHALADTKPAAADHLVLMTWLSPSFPVGAFAYSHGLEWAYDCGDVTNAAALQGWLIDLIDHGAARNDAIFFVETWRVVETWRAVDAGDAARLSNITELSLALANSTERRLETVTQGNAFMNVIEASWPNAGTTLLRGTVQGDTPYPIAVAAAAAGHGMAREAALQAMLLAFIANLISASVRLGIIGQTDGQRITAALVPNVMALAQASMGRTLADLGSAVFRADIGALRHETQYSRLFRS
jgi:urease accessory protein